MSVLNRLLCLSLQTSDVLPQPVGRSDPLPSALVAKLLHIPIYGISWSLYKFELIGLGRRQRTDGESEMVSGRVLAAKDQVAQVEGWRFCILFMLKKWQGSPQLRRQTFCLLSGAGRGQSGPSERG